VHTVPAISSVDHHTPVILFRADMCINSRVVITQSVLFGHMITITEVSETSQGITSEITSQSSAMNHSSNASHSAANGFTTDIETSIDTNVTIHALFNSTESDAVAQKAMERMPHRRSAPVGHPLHPESERRRHEHADTMRNRFALGGNSAFILCVIMRLLYRKSI